MSAKIEDLRRDVKFDLTGDRNRTEVSDAVVRLDSRLNQLGASLSYSTTLSFQPKPQFVLSAAASSTGAIINSSRSAFPLVSTPDLSLRMTEWLPSRYLAAVGSGYSSFVPVSFGIYKNIGTYNNMPFALSFRF